MLVKCWILLEVNENGQIVSAISPDNKIELLDHSLQIDGYQYVVGTLAQENLQASYIIFPKDLDELNTMPRNNMQHWECFLVNLTISKMDAAYILPAIGNACNFYNILSGSFVTFMALQTASHQKEDNYISMSVIGGVLNFFFNIIIYLYSDAGTVLAKLGWRTGKLFNNEHSYNDYLRDCTWGNNKRLGYSILMCVCIMLNVSLTAIKLSQEHILLTDKFLDLYQNLEEDERDLYRRLIIWMVINLGISSGIYCAIAFQLSFALKLINKIAPNDTPNHIYQPTLNRFNSMMAGSTRLPSNNLAQRTDRITAEEGEGERESLVRELRL